MRAHPHPILRPDRHFRLPGVVRPTQRAQDLLAGTGLHDWLAGLNYQARSVLAIIRGVVAALADL
jgi:hypothetical protein